MLDFVRNGKFGPFFFYSKFIITCKKASLVHFQIIRKGKFGPDSEKNLDQTCLFKASRTRDSNYSKKSILILNSFKHFSGPKYKTLGNFKLVFSTLFLVEVCMGSAWAVHGLCMSHAPWLHFIALVTHHGYLNRTSIILDPNL